MAQSAGSRRGGHFTLSEANVQLGALSSSSALAAAEGKVEDVSDLGGECFPRLQVFLTSSH